MSPSDLLGSDMWGVCNIKGSVIAWKCVGAGYVNIALTLNSYAVSWGSLYIKPNHNYKW